MILVRGRKYTKKTWFLPLSTLISLLCLLRISETVSAYFCLVLELCLTCDLQVNLELMITFY